MVLKTPPTLEVTCKINHLHSYPTPRNPPLFFYYIYIYIYIMNIYIYICACLSGRADEGVGVRPLVC